MLLTRACVTAVVAAGLFGVAGTAVAAPTVSRFDDGSFEYPAVAASTFRTAGPDITRGVVVVAAEDVAAARVRRAARYAPVG
ncbi:hypothetical protein V1L54_28510 [Streptomyces sp. TRM 70361]|uniref:hypothetical protein n=1 Tax=Streptomyces sp. TRM 70361 TaxID=3116553 RepID=UPI002E7B3361|nr:hypothetical protein [Streptomyces sp. TRM 70361]MEE1943300.1 hypothetical protein [Streptomyces sp. TRM 70361]